VSAPLVETDRPASLVTRFAGPASVPRNSLGGVVVLGVFDGLHRGHLSLLDHARLLSCDGDVPVVLATFDPHPASIAGRSRDITSLVSLERRAEIAAQQGADATVVIPFDRGVSLMSPEVFVRSVLVDGLDATHVVVGEGFRFGRDAAGDVDRLTELGRSHGFEVHALLRVPGCSSTTIRTLLRRGRVEDAGDILGRAHRVYGTGAGTVVTIDEGMVPAPARYLVAVGTPDAVEIEATLRGRVLEARSCVGHRRLAVDFLRRV